jgi:multiple sugar transport system ATP-binding protein
MAEVVISNVHKTFGRTNIIGGVSFEAHDGEFVVLVGPSGCGKSTLLRMIAGLENVTSGEIRIDGRVVNDLPPKDRDIAMVFQNYALYPHMNVAENMAFSLKLRGTPQAEIQQKVQRAAEILGLTHLLDRLPRELSGGQRQRVAMGRAIVRNPRLFLFDEPLSNLDSKLRVQMRTEIKDLHRRLGATTMYVTHDQIEAMTMADRIAVLNGGFIEQMGPPLELFDRPVNRFVAGFIGSPAMNFLDATVTASTANGVVIKGHDWELQVPTGPGLEVGRQVTLGVRPEHFDLTDDARALQAKVQIVEPTGSETYIHAAIGEHPVTCVTRVRLSAQPGDTIRLAPHADRLHLFDRESGKRIGD